VDRPEAEGALSVESRQPREHLADSIGASRHPILIGVEPSALFESRDGGASWALNDGLWKHPHREKWMPGGGGLCLHTVLVDPVRPGRMIVATSTGGAYRTDDGGRSWHVKNRGVRAEFLPERYPEFGQCVHKIAQSRSKPERMYLQNHWGLYRSDDAGDSWRDMANGVGRTSAAVGSTCARLRAHRAAPPDGFRCVPGSPPTARAETAATRVGCNRLP
jgi:photosystem II stability/assembly factor-like uncharacterized protein